MTAEQPDCSHAKATTSPGALAIVWVDEHGDALFRYALSKLHFTEAAEDVVQETFLAALASWERFRGKSSVRTWLIGILRRKIADAHRKNQEESPRLHQGANPHNDHFFDAKGRWIEPPCRLRMPSEILEANELRALLDDCIDSLPQRLAQVFLLREVDHLDLGEIHRSLKLSHANLRVLLHRARLYLRECLERKAFMP